MVTTSGSGVEEPAADEAAEQSPPPHKQRRSKPKKEKQPRLSRVAMEFQPDAVEIERRSVPGGARWTLYVVIGLIIAAVTWASLTKVNRIVVAEGKLVTAETPVVVQAADLSQIREVLVNFGDIVKPGQDLAIMDTTFSDTDIDKLEKDLASLDAQIARLKAEQFEQPFEIPADAGLELQREHAHYLARKNALDSSLLEIDQQVARTEASIEKNTALIVEYKKRLEFLQTDLERLEELKEKSIVRETDVLARRDSINVAQIDTRRFELEMEEFRAEQQGYFKRAESIRAETMKEVIQALSEALTKRNEVVSQLAKAQRMADLAVLRVPSDLPYPEYMVTEVAERSQQSVMREGEPLFKLIPRDADLEVEVTIPGRDIGRIANGDTVRVKFAAFPYQKHETADGKIHKIIEESLAPQSGQADAASQPRDGQAPAAVAFRARIDLADNWQGQLKNIPDGTRFYPGMATTNEIKIGERRVIEYFIYPLLRGLDSSLREP